MIQVMLNMGADPAAESRGQTPLQIAAARGPVSRGSGRGRNLVLCLTTEVRGYLDAMGMLLNSSAPTDGSLAAAASRCQVEAMELPKLRASSKLRCLLRWVPGISCMDSGGL